MRKGGIVVISGQPENLSDRPSTVQERGVQKNTSHSRSGSDPA